MSESMFGVSRRKPSRKQAKQIEAIAKNNNAEWVECFNLPGTGYQSWFTSENLGEPFNGDRAESVARDLENAGISILADAERDAVVGR